ncbi:MAG: Crp/Fnr family transcriptional regulator [Rhodothermales bacterium]
MSIPRRIIDTLRYTYQRMFQRQEDNRAHEVVEVLKQVTLFQGFSQNALRELAEVMHRRSYRRDEFLYYENDPGLGLYIVQRGCVRLLVEDENGGVHERYQAVENEFFGEISILGDYRRMETAQAATETKVLGFFSPDLKTILKRNPSLGASMVMALARHLATQQVSMTQRVIEERGKVPALRLLAGGTQQAERAHSIT